MKHSKTLQRQFSDDIFTLTLKKEFSISSQLALNALRPLQSRFKKNHHGDHGTLSYAVFPVAFSNYIRKVL